MPNAVDPTKFDSYEEYKEYMDYAAGKLPDTRSDTHKALGLPTDQEDAEQLEGLKVMSGGLAALLGAGPVGTGIKAAGAAAAPVLAKGAELAVKAAPYAAYAATGLNQLKQLFGGGGSRGGDR